MNVLALTGGVGGAKLGLGLSHLLTPNELSFVVNTGDDFEHLGLHISPDVDTLTYTLAGLANPETGWGREQESWAFIETLEALGGEAWFRLGDRDLALHITRRQLLAEGQGLTAATAKICERLGVAYRILPMTDASVQTRVLTTDGPLAFQHYFVRDRCEPTVTGFEFAGSDRATLTTAVASVLQGHLDAIVICPSNPFVSVDPVLAVPGMRDAIAKNGAPVIAVTPIVAGEALKGPTAKMMRELGVPATTSQVAAHYEGLASDFVVDELDATAAADVAKLGMQAHVAQTVMRSLDDRIELARRVLDIARS